MVLGIIIAVCSALFMAGMYILLKKSYEELDPSVAFFFNAILAVVIWIPVGFIFGGSIAELPRVLPFAIISALLAEVFVFYAVSKGNLSVATTLIATYPVYTVLFSFLINNEILSIFQVGFILVTVLGIVLTCIEKGVKIKSFINPITIIPILAAVAIGLSDTLSKLIINETSSFSFIIALAIVQIPVALIYLRITKHKIGNIFSEMKIKKVIYSYGVVASLMNVIGTGLLLISFNFAYASIASPLTAIYTPIVLLYAFMFMKEKLSKVNLVGIIFAMIGAIGIIFFS